MGKQYEEVFDSMSIFDTIEVERNGRIWRLHWKNRYDPITLLVAGAVSTAVGVGQTLQEGRQAEKIAKARAQIDLEDAKAARRSSVEEATIEKERSVRARATAKAAAAAGGIQVNVGLPLVIDTQIAAATAKDIGFILERGRVTERAFLSSAALEIAQGKALKRKSKFDALRLGLLGGASLGLSASQAGLFSKSTNIAPAGTFKATTGISQKKFGRQFIKTGFRP